MNVDCCCSWLSLYFRFLLFSAKATFLVLSPIFTPDYTVERQEGRSSARSSQEETSILHCFMSFLQTSLKRRWGRPVGRVPLASSPYRRSFGIRPVSILYTWPSQRRRLSRKMVTMLFMPACCSTSMSGTLSCQRVCRMCRRHLRWKLCSLLSCLT